VNAAPAPLTVASTNNRLTPARRAVPVPVDLVVLVIVVILNIKIAVRRAEKRDVLERERERDTGIRAKPLPFRGRSENARNCSENLG
jgi:hypothetical protein